MSDGALLEVDGLSVARGGRVVVDGVSLRAHAGDLIAVVGPNGAGKSTLFAALLGLIPSTGRLSLRGRLAYVPQHETSARHFPVTALDVALMGAYARVKPYRRLGRVERQAALDALGRVGLEAEADRTFGELSGGQRQRVLLARSLVQRGSILLLDEPLSGVDAPSEEAIVQALAQERTAGHAVLIATHDLAFARRACTHALLLNTRTYAFGPPGEALTADTLRAAYGERLIVLDEHGGHDAIDEGSHHVHGVPGSAELETEDRPG